MPAATLLPTPRLGRPARVQRAMQGDTFVEPRLRVHVWLCAWLALGVMSRSTNTTSAAPAFVSSVAFPTADGGGDHAQ
ncbi:MAG TPA: hypothetical protein VIV11_16010 [Kofleriaceae bacterium]